MCSLLCERCFILCESLFDASSESFVSQQHFMTALNHFSSSSSSTFCSLCVCVFFIALRSSQTRIE